MGRASQAACEINSSSPSSPGTETTGRIRPPGSASHSRGLSSAAGRRGAEPITQSSQEAGTPGSAPLAELGDALRVLRQLVTVRSVAATDSYGRTMVETANHPFCVLGAKQPGPLLEGPARN